MEKELITTLILLLFINVFGYIYSYLIVTKRIFKDNKIQIQERTNISYLNKHIRLFSFNVITLMFFVFIVTVEILLFHYTTIHSFKMSLIHHI